MPCVVLQDDNLVLLIIADLIYLLEDPDNSTQILLLLLHKRFHLSNLLYIEAKHTQHYQTPHDSGEEDDW